MEKKLKNARAKLEVIFKKMVEKPKQANFYKYYANYYWVRASDLQIRIWIRELEDLSHQKNLENKKVDLKPKLKQIEKALIDMLANVRKCDAEANEKNWKLRFWYPTLHDYIKKVYKEAATLRRKIKSLRSTF